MDHNSLLTKLRWETVYNGFGMTYLCLDCFYFKFRHCGLTQDEQIKLMDFMGDSDNLNSLTVIDFCNMLLNNNIEFSLKFKYCRKRTIKHNLCSYMIIKNCNKQMRKTRQASGACTDGIKGR